jgi:hypothetical protein
VRLPPSLLANLQQSIIADNLRETEHTEREKESKDVWQITTKTKYIMKKMFVCMCSTPRKRNEKL